MAAVEYLELTGVFVCLSVVSQGTSDNVGTMQGLEVRDRHTEAGQDDLILFVIYIRYQQS